MQLKSQNFRLSVKDLRVKNFCEIIYQKKQTTSREVTKQTKQSYCILSFKAAHIVEQIMPF